VPERKDAVLAMMKLSDYVMRFIAEMGVKHVFMLPGGGAMHLNDSLGQCKELEYVCTLHEQAASIAAEAYARVTNNLGVAMVTTGPGGTNAITGVAGAWLESTPVLILSGQVKRADLKRDMGVRQLGPQELDIVSMVQSITKYAVMVTDPATIRYHLEKAVYLARSGRKGPVWIDIPLDVQASQIIPEDLSQFDPGEFQTSFSGSDLKAEVAHAIHLINSAERPAILAGNGIRAAGARPAFLHFLEYRPIPVLTTWMGTDLLYDSHPCFVGKPGTVAQRGANFILQNCDLLVAIGARLDFPVTGFDQSQCARGAKKIVVDIDPAEIRKLSLGDVRPVVADAKAFIDELWSQRGRLQPRDLGTWFTRCGEWKSRYPIVLAEHRQQGQYVSTYVLGEALAEALTGDDLIIPGSSGAGLDRFWLSFQVKPEQRLFSTGGLGAMGFGLPAALGGCLAGGRKRTISVDGDGGFQMNIQELQTVARLNLPIKFFVLNNQGYASIRGSQRNYFKRLMACDKTSGLTLPDVTRVAGAYGIHSVRIADACNLRQQIREVLQTPGPVVCDVMTDPEEITQPRVSSAIRADGSMVSRPLEDLFPFLDRDELRSNMIIPPLED
jgi:acetolactate synthase-1/2/3 large subunit